MDETTLSIITLSLTFLTAGVCLALNYFTESSHPDIIQLQSAKTRLINGEDPYVVMKLFTDSVQMDPKDQVKYYNLLIKDLEVGDDHRNIVTSRFLSLLNDEITRGYAIWSKDPDPLLEAVSDPTSFSNPFDCIFFDPSVFFYDFSFSASIFGGFFFLFCYLEFLFK